MPVSYAEQVPLTCPECGHEVIAEVWLIVHAVERPDLIERARDSTLHRITCPQCGHTGNLDAPLLIFTPPDMGTNRPPLLFSPAQQTTAEQDREHAAGLLARLRDALGDTWRDEWAEQAQMVSRPLLTVVLADDPEAEMRRLAEEAARAIELLREMQRISQEEPLSSEELSRLRRFFLAPGLPSVPPLIFICPVEGCTYQERSVDPNHAGECPKHHVPLVRADGPHGTGASEDEEA